MENLFGQQHEGYSKEITKEFFRNVYSYMFAGLAISGALAYWCGTEEFYRTYFMNNNGGKSMLYYVVTFAPFILGMVIFTSFRRFSLSLLIMLFFLYSALLGASLSVIFLVYTNSAIASTFFIAAGGFGAMAILGYTTKTDLSKMGSLLYMALIGLVIAMLVNYFMKSEFFDYIISIIGVFVFTGLTAYDMQKLKQISNDTTLSTDDRNKIALIGGFDLYLNFVNLFLFLLRLLGNRD